MNLRELKVTQFACLLVGKKVKDVPKFPREVEPLLSKFRDLIPEELPDSLPPKRDI